MENSMNFTPEELRAMVEKAQKEAEEALSKLSPEEREQAIAKAEKMIEENRIETQKILDDAAEILGKTAPETDKIFCAACGAPSEGGKFCEYCGSPLGGTVN